MPRPTKDGTPLPDIIDPPETMAITLCIPKNRSYMSSFFGALYQLTYWNYWENNEAHDGEKVAAVWWRYYQSWDRNMTDTECEDGMNYCCEERPKEKRIDPDTGLMQISTDGGTTWTTDPNEPSLFITKPAPPVTAGTIDTACTAALNAYNAAFGIVNDTSSNIATASTVYELATLVVAALLNVFFIVTTGGLATPFINTITGIIWGAGTAAFEMGQAAFDAYWTADVLKELKCALIENIGADGSFTDAQYQGFRNQFKFNTPSSPARDMVLTAIGVGGAQGLSTMAAYGDASGGNCDECSEEYIRIYALCNGTLGGTELDWDGEYLTVQAYNAGSNYVVRIVRDPVASASCVDETLTPQFVIAVEGVEYVSGAADFVEFMNEANGYSGQFPGLTPPWLVGPAHRYTFTSAGPFTMKIKAVEA